MEGKPVIDMDKYRSGYRADESLRCTDEFVADAEVAHLSVSIDNAN